MTVGALLVAALAVVSLGVSQALFDSVARAQTAKRAQTDAEITQAIIRDAIAKYVGNCPCPYNVDRAGRSCGRRSAYVRPGGASPLCYPKDVTRKMVDDYRAGRGEKAPPRAQGPKPKA